MNTQEAREILQKALEDYESKTYSDLLSLIGKELYFEKPGPSGVQYQIEILVMWDSKPNGTIMVIGSIDDGGWRAFAPLTQSFLKYPPEQ